MMGKSSFQFRKKRKNAEIKTLVSSTIQSLKPLALKKKSDNNIEKTRRIQFQKISNIIRIKQKYMKISHMKTNFNLAKNMSFNQIDGKPNLLKRKRRQFQAPCKYRKTDSNEMFIPFINESLWKRIPMSCNCDFYIFGKLHVTQINCSFHAHVANIEEVSNIHSSLLPFNTIKSNNIKQENIKITETVPVPIPSAFKTTTEKVTNLDLAKSTLCEINQKNITVVDSKSLIIELQPNCMTKNIANEIESQDSELKSNSSQEIEEEQNKVVPKTNTLSNCDLSKNTMETISISQCNALKPHTQVLKKHHLFNKGQSSVCFANSNVATTSNNTDNRNVAETQMAPLQSLVNINSINVSQSATTNTDLEIKQKYQSTSNYNNKIPTIDVLKSDIIRNSPKSIENYKSANVIINNTSISSTFNSTNCFTNSPKSGCMSISLTSMPQMPKHSVAKVTTISAPLQFVSKISTAQLQNYALDQPSSTNIYRVKCGSAKIINNTQEKLKPVIPLKSVESYERKTIVKTADKSFVISKQPSLTKTLPSTNKVSIATVASTTGPITTIPPTSLMLANSSINISPLPINVYQCKNNGNVIQQLPVKISLSSCSPTSSTSSNSSIPANKFNDNSSDSGFDENMLERKSLSPKEDDIDKKTTVGSAVQTMFLASGVQIQGQTQNVLFTGNDTAAKLLQNRKMEAQQRQQLNLQQRQRLQLSSMVQQQQRPQQHVQIHQHKSWMQQQQQQPQGHALMTTPVTTIRSNATNGSVKIAQICTAPKILNNGSGAISGIGFVATGLGNTCQTNGTTSTSSRISALCKNNTIRHENGITTIVPASSLTANSQTAAMNYIQPNSVSIIPAPKPGSNHYNICNAATNVVHKFNTPSLINLQSNNHNQNNISTGQQRVMIQPCKTFVNNNTTITSTEAITLPSIGHINNNNTNSGNGNYMINQHVYSNIQNSTNANLPSKIIVLKTAPSTSLSLRGSSISTTNGVIPITVATTTAPTNIPSAIKYNRNVLTTLSMGINGRFIVGSTSNSGNVIENNRIDNKISKC